MKTEKNILIAFILNIVFSIFEVLGGVFTNSISILAIYFSISKQDIIPPKLMGGSVSRVIQRI